MNRTAASTPLARLRAPDLALAAAVVAAALLVFALSPAQWLWGDGTFLLEQYVEGRSFWMHATYLPLARLLSHVPGLSEPVTALRAASALGMALGLACAFLIARRVGADRIGAVAVTALLAFAPAVWFFALQVEVHGTQFATLAIAVLVLLAAPWRVPVLAIFVSALAMWIAHLGHQSSPALGPGFVLLARYAASRSGRRLSWPTTLFVVGPALVVALVLGDATLHLLGQPTVLFAQSHLAAEFAAEHHNPPSLRWWRDDVVVPLGFALVPIAAGAMALALRARSDRDAAREAVALLVVVAVPMVVFALWAVDNRGGYLAAALPFAAWIGTRAVPQGRPRYVVLAVLFALVPFQARRAYDDLRAESLQWDRERHLRRAGAVAAALPEGGYLIAFQTDPQSVQQFVPSVRELQWFWPLQDSLRAGEPVESLIERLVDPLVTDTGLRAIAFDLDHHRYADHPGLEEWVARVRAIEAALAGHFETVPVADAGWPLVRLVPR